MLTSRRIRLRPHICSLAIIFGAICLPPNLDVKAWLDRHSGEMRREGLLLLMRFYSKC
jgi:hypothetical protein